MRVLKAGVIYFALAFGAGFMLGSVRVLWAVPRFGARTAELMETPLMLIAFIFSAQLAVRAFNVPSGFLSRLGMGLIALGLMLSAEFTLMLRLRGLSISDYFAALDPVAGTVYFIMLGVFALMPLAVARRT